MRDPKHAGAQALVHPPEALLLQHFRQHSRRRGALTPLHDQPCPHHGERVRGHCCDDSRSQCGSEVLSRSQRLSIGVALGELRLYSTVTADESKLSVERWVPIDKIFAR